MSTKLEKPVTRLSGLEYNGRKVLVTFEPGDTLSFKPVGLKEPSRVRISLERAYHLARGGTLAAPVPPPVVIPAATDGETVAYIRALEYLQWALGRNPKLARSILTDSNRGPDQWELIEILQQEKVHHALRGSNDRQHTASKES